MTAHATHNHQAGHSGAFSLENIPAYDAWRENKLSDYPTGPNELMVEISDLNAPNPGETELIRKNCNRTNLSFYRTTPTAASHDKQATRNNLIAFAAQFGLSTTETHRSAGGDGIVTLEVTDNKAQAGYIPYTNRRLSWHTDGYYNYHGPDHAIRAMLMHCARPAETGGENAYLDPDIAYIRLRDENPAFIKVLMSDQAMSIPENREENGNLRPTNTGPVFFIDASAHLNMRYTARTRNIIWNENSLTSEAVQYLNHILDTDPLIIRKRLGTGEGVICNNVLHNRTGFDKDEPECSDRLLYRARYLNIVS